MILPTLASALIYYSATKTQDLAEQPAGVVYYSQIYYDGVKEGMSRYNQPPVIVKPLAETQFRGVVRQAYDYSCGSAALTTILNGYLGKNLTEKQTMNGLLRFGEYDRIVERRSFSLLDMKRFMTALGYQSGGFKGTLEDLKGIEQPAIIPIAYAGFKHFVVYKGNKDGRIFLADPALGNISFTETHFLDVWNDNTLFLVTPNEAEQTLGLLDIDDKDMRIVEDATVNHYAFAQVAYPDRARQQEIDTASTLKSVIDKDENSLTYGQPIDIGQRLYYKRK